MQTYKALAALLSYPGENLIGAARGGEIEAVLTAEGLLDGKCIAALKPLLQELAEWDQMDLEERYVDLFDRSRSRSLHLFEHVHGESRDRGQAMVDLRTMYAQAGLEIADNELPDFLPLYLEYLSTLGAEQARQRLGQPIHVVAAVGERLKRRGSSYAAVFQALEYLSEAKADRGELDVLLAEGDDDPNDKARLDKTWAEEPVTFGPQAPGTGGNDCGRIKQIAERIAAAKGRGKDAGQSSARG
ncbi:nitrate reductase molybdenum cofactor assembly chaperone [Ferruginivarius sediminum]|uniref:Nitrate reductase molybdenum cofactor assembly chaperone n=1 Tax=Ferruginivarius sediminum TaxID=2661937 RepID=A0A369TCM5_9PROT|nr:nitrate reductase molybdenum cofactor assembly chaperone [Ferruginivarius sediminum]RDD63040.1 nitrate reductase molybdenum cofactor assembly chaperone [Ferruginivarius sediminum]